MKCGVGIRRFLQAAAVAMFIYQTEEAIRKESHVKLFYIITFNFFLQRQVRNLQLKGAVYIFPFI